jgi:hypothetical protein
VKIECLQDGGRCHLQFCQSFISDAFHECYVTNAFFTSQG